MSSMSKKLIKKLSTFILCFILSFYLTIQFSLGEYKFKIQNWVEDIPILPSLIENKRDVVEFDSSNGKIISISFGIKTLSKNKILSFYRDFFQQVKWEKVENKNIWREKNNQFKKKIFKIENLKDNVLTIKIIVENF